MKLNNKILLIKFIALGFQPQELMQYYFILYFFNSKNKKHV